MIHKNIPRRQGKKAINLLNLKITTMALPNFTSQLGSPKDQWFTTLVVHWNYLGALKLLIPGLHLRDFDLIGLGCGPGPQDLFVRSPGDATCAEEAENHCFR